MNVLFDVEMGVYLANAKSFARCSEIGSFWVCLDKDTPIPLVNGFITIRLEKRVNDVFDEWCMVDWIGIIDINLIKMKVNEIFFLRKKMLCICHLHIR